MYYYRIVPSIIQQNIRLHENSVPYFIFLIQTDTDTDTNIFSQNLFHFFCNRISFNAFINFVVKFKFYSN